MPTLPNTRELTSPDHRRIARFEPHVMEVAGKPFSAYRVIRTVRTRRGFGTIIHTLTTFVRDKKSAQRHIAQWVRIKTKDGR